MAKFKRATIERLAGKVVNRLLPKTVMDAPLPEQVGMAYKAMGIMGIPKFRAYFLREGGFQTDLEDLFKAGKTAEEIKDYYWSCAKFKKFWGDIWQTEQGLDDLIEKAAKCV
jgi:hypothetical protein